MSHGNYLSKYGNSFFTVFDNSYSTPLLKIKVCSSNLQLGWPLISVFGIFLPSVVEHQQKPVEAWHCKGE